MDGSHLEAFADFDSSSAALGTFGRVHLPSLECHTGFDYSFEPAVWHQHLTLASDCGDQANGLELGSLFPMGRCLEGCYRAMSLFADL